MTRYSRNDRSFSPNENSDSASNSSGSTLSSARSARTASTSLDRISTAPGPSSDSSELRNRAGSALRRMTEQTIAGKDSQITAVLDSWVNRYGVPKDWRKWVKFDPDYRRTTEEHQRQLSQYEKMACERTYSQQEPFQLYGTAQYYDFDLLKSWVQFQVFRSYGDIWPPGYTPQIQKDVDS
ncbi:MAG: hypothetical protein Q9182_007656, partial [Xanthomendoza sp. 2 TL-2023]